jgi:phospholipase C
MADATVMRRLLTVFACLLAAVSSASTAGALPAPLPSASATPLCGALAGQPVSVSHVIVIVMENHSYRDLIGRAGSSAASQAPYINGTLKRDCGLATNYHAVSHPSLPNYIALVAGSRGGISTDCTSCTSGAGNVFRQLGAAGRSWRVYAESMPSSCSRLASAGEYLKRHNPATYFPAIASDCARWDVPMGGSSGHLAEALSRNRLHAYSMVVPNACNDMHDCSIATGDHWLSTWIPRITHTADYRAGRTAVFVVWDEGEGGGYGGEDCLAQLSDQSCHVPALVLSAYTPAGTRSSLLFSHLSVLRTAQSLLGLSPFLGGSAHANGMRRPFGL